MKQLEVVIAVHTQLVGNNHRRVLTFSDYYSPKPKTQTLSPRGDGDVSVVLCVMWGGQLEDDAVIQHNSFHRHNNWQWWN